LHNLALILSLHVQLLNLLLFLAGSLCGMLHQSAGYVTSWLQKQLLLLHFIYVGASDRLIVVKLARLTYCHFCLIHLGVKATVERIRNNGAHIVI
jgi:hypothetical protein